MKKNNIKSMNKIKGALYGFAIGDAIGATTEFLTAGQVRNRYGSVDDMIGGGWLDLVPGQVTDDTQMMLCVMRAIMKSFYEDLGLTFLQYCKSEFIKWLDTNPVDVGNQCRKAILNLKADEKKIFQEIDNDALGNGSLMRAVPCAIISKLDYNTQQGKLTHNNEICTSLIRYYHIVLENLLYSDGPYFSIEMDENEHYWPSTPSGHAVDTFYNCLYWYKFTHTFEDAVLSAVNNGGDADTIAALTGGLAGAKYGFDSIPKKWVDKLDKNVVEEIEQFVQFLLDLQEIITNKKEV